MGSIPIDHSNFGKVAEWFIALVLKTSDRATDPRVQISPFPLKPKKKLSIFLTRMGYREISPNRWVKPVAFTLFAIEIKSDEIVVAMWFVGRQGQLLRLCKQ